MEASIYEAMSKSEKKVAKYLKKLGIPWEYEKPVFIWDETDRPRVWAPDFFLASFGLYVEVCGSENFDYDYRKRIYMENGYFVIFLHLYKEPDKWKNHFIEVLTGITASRNEDLKEITNKL
jgi:hypothetical protein